MPTFYYVTLGTFHVMCVWITSSCWEPVASCGCNDRLNPRRRASHRLWDGRVLNKGEEQTDVRKQPIIISHFMKVHLPNRIQQIERGTNKLWPSVLPILSFTMCSVCSEQQCIMLNFMNTLQLGDPWLAHSTEEIRGQETVQLVLDVNHRPTVLLWKRGNEKKSNMTNERHKTEGRICSSFPRKVFAFMCRVLTSPYPMIYFSLLKPKRHDISK